MFIRNRFGSTHMSFDMREVFKDDKDNEMGKFLSKVFGIFNEDIVRAWCDNKESEYGDLGRPTIYEKGSDKKGKTLDFTFKDERTGKVYVGELKCLIEFKDYHYLELKNQDITIHTGRKRDENWREKTNNAFVWFLDIAENSEKYNVIYTNRKKDNGKLGERIPTTVNGSILVWGRVTDEGREKVKKEFGIHDVLSLEDMINDLIKWKDPEYKEFINKRYCWLLNLMESLYGEQLECSE